MQNWIANDSAIVLEVSTFYYGTEQTARNRNPIILSLAPRCAPTLFFDQLDTTTVSVSTCNHPAKHAILLLGLCTVDGDHLVSFPTIHDRTDAEEK